MYKKDFYEFYALISLINCYDRSLSSLLDSNTSYERPDFQSYELDIGIEITEAITKKHGEERFIINEYFGKQLTGDEVKSKAEKRFGKKIKGKISVFNSIAVYSEHRGLVNTSNYCDRITACVYDKTIKLNDGYNLFNRNWLYVFAHTSILNAEDMDLMVKKWKFSSKLSFDKIIINCVDKLYIIGNQMIETIIINDESLKEIKSSSLNLDR